MTITNKRKYWLKAIIFSLLLLLITYNSILAIGENLSFKSQKIVAHAMGEVDNKFYTNSLEAFKENYNRGIKIFEVDLVLTKDSKIVLRHFWNEDNLSSNKEAKKLELKEFKKQKILNKYTPLDINDLLDLMSKYKDTYFILDVKEGDEKTINYIYSQVVKSVEHIDKNLFNRLIPQILSYDVYYKVKEYNLFPMICFAMYDGKKSEKEVLDFITKEDIYAISMWEGQFNIDFINKIKAEKSYVWVHTVNSEKKARELLENGADIIYSDTLYKLNKESK